jgi:hypothetical protein
MPLQKRPRFRCRREGDGNDLPAQLLDFRLASLHLTEMLAAGYSGKMAKEDEDEGFGAEVGQTRARAVETLELAIGNLVTQSELHGASLYVTDRSASFQVAFSMPSFDPLDSILRTGERLRADALSDSLMMTWRRVSPAKWPATTTQTVATLVVTKRIAAIIAARVLPK